MAEATLTVRGLRENIELVRGMEARMKDLRPALEAGSAAIVKFVDDRFRESTDPSGIAWEPLAESTLANRRGTTATILVDTARLRNSIHALATAKGISWGASALYAIHHQLGTVDTPQRRFLPVVLQGGRWILDTEGPAGALWQDIFDTIERYVRTGKLR